MRTPTPLPLLSLVLLLGIGCTSPRFSYDGERTFPQAPYLTAAPDPRTDRVIIREGLRPLGAGSHREAALEELKDRNYLLADPQEADLWVAVFLLGEAPPEGRGESSPKASRGDAGGEGHRGGKRGGAGGGGASGPGKGPQGPKAAQGWTPNGKYTVIVQLSDRKTGVPVWHGEANLHSKDRAADGGPLTPAEAIHQLLQPLRACTVRP